MGVTSSPRLVTFAVLEFARELKRRSSVGIVGWTEGWKAVTCRGGCGGVGGFSGRGPQQLLVGGFNPFEKYLSVGIIIPDI